MKVISFDSKICQNLDQAIKKEWLETNQFGGFASSTIVSVNTRRQHGLLVAQLKPPLGHHVLLNTLEEVLFIDDIAYPLSTQIRADTVYPEGYRNLNEFSLLPFPTWVFRVEDLVLAKTIIFMHDEQTVLIRYQILEGDANLVRLELRPLTAFRHFQSLTHKNERLNKKIELASGKIQFAGLFFYHNAAIVDQAGAWYGRVQYTEEKQRSLEFEEDLYAPFHLLYTFTRDREIFLCASLENNAIFEPQALVSKEQDRRFRLFKSIHIPDPRFQILAYSGQSFFVNPIRIDDLSQTKKIADKFTSVKRLLPKEVNFDETQLSEFSKILKQDLLKTAIIANYPWCEDSPRDALIALHGLTLTVGQYQVARHVLTHIAGQVKDGLLPNRWFDRGETDLVSDYNRQPDYSAMDTPLWLIHSSFEYLKYSEDYEMVEHKLFPVLSSIIECFVKGTHFNIHVTSDGLVSGAATGHALTWMDAKAGNSIVTPREGKPVEIQALWFNALCIMAFMSDLFGKTTSKKAYEELARRAKKSFNRLFWDAANGYLCDVIDLEGKKDSSLRPNQLLAMGLPFPILEEEAFKWRSISDVTKNHLLTPYGLRTLAPHEQNYCKSCDGDKFHRVQAYHQGTVWPWLFIPFLLALLRVEKDPKRTKEQFLNFLNPFFAHIEDRGLGFISERFDGDPPHQARGAIAQAINVGSGLELYEILLGQDSILEKAHVLTLR